MVLGWDEQRHKDMEIGTRVLKVWEMVFESFPTICLQSWISLYTDLDINIVLSLLVGLLTISFTFFRILYSDRHPTESRESEQMIVRRVHERRSTLRNNMTFHVRSASSFSPDQTGNAGNTLNDDDINEDKEEIDPPLQRRRTSLHENIARLRSAATAVDDSAKFKELWKHFICCYPVKLMLNRLRKKEDDNATKKEKKSYFDQIYYVVLYLWVMTDFGIRIFPVLVWSWLQQEPLKFVAAMLALTLFEFLSHYVMLDGDFKTPRNTTHFFWTLYFTVSYCLLSSMHLSYLPNNVRFGRLVIEHCLRLMIQSVFMALAMSLQAQRYGSSLGYFLKSIVGFWCFWTLNWVLTAVVYRGYARFIGELQTVLYSPRGSTAAPVAGAVPVDVEMVLEDMQQIKSADDELSDSTPSYKE